MKYTSSDQQICSFEFIGDFVNSQFNGFYLCGSHSCACTTVTGEYYVALLDKVEGEMKEKGPL